MWRQQHQGREGSQLLVVMCYLQSILLAVTFIGFFPFLAICAPLAPASMADGLAPGNLGSDADQIRSANQWRSRSTMWSSDLRESWAEVESRSDFSIICQICTLWWISDQWNSHGQGPRWSGPKLSGRCLLLRRSIVLVIWPKLIQQS